MQEDVTMLHAPLSQTELSLEQRSDILSRANRLYSAGLMPGMIIQAMSRRFARPVEEMEVLLQSLLPLRETSPGRAH